MDDAKYGNIIPLLLEDTTFSDYKRCACCEEKTHEFYVHLACSGGQNYCRSCIVNQRAILQPYISHESDICEGCERAVSEICHFIAVAKSSLDAYRYCKSCIKKLVYQVELLYGKLESGFYEFISDQPKLQQPLVQKKRQSLPKGIRHEVLKRDNFRCKDCGTTKDDEPLEVDHIIPVSRGGTDELSNLQTLCRTCNREKNDLIFKGGAESLGT